MYDWKKELELLEHLEELCIKINLKLLDIKELNIKDNLQLSDFQRQRLIKLRARRNKELRNSFMRILNPNLII